MIMTNSEDITNFLIQLIRNPDHSSFGAYGYDVYLPNLLYTYYRKQNIPDDQIHGKIKEISPLLYSAAWDLCRRGILRPGIKCYGEQATDAGNAGDGYSITPFGRQWLSEAHTDLYIPTEPGRFAALLAQYKEKFGPGFQERAQQAIICYRSQAFLACCVMCGAAAESIILAAAIAKENDEEKVLKEYSSAQGRKKIEGVLIGKAKLNLQEDYRNNSYLLKYWRDEAAHGKSSNISDNEAYTSLALLLRFALFINNNWNELVNAK